MSYANKIGTCEYCGCTLDSTDQVFYIFTRPVCPPCYDNANETPNDHNDSDRDIDDREPSGAWS